MPWMYIKGTTRQTPQHYYPKQEKGSPYRTSLCGHVAQLSTLTCAQIINKCEKCEEILQRILQGIPEKHTQSGWYDVEGTTRAHYLLDKPRYLPRDAKTAEAICGYTTLRSRCSQNTDKSRRCELCKTRTTGLKDGWNKK